jgi:peptidoglycan/xylan/chitin deacetylase (PgdA/CDA1 family)
MNLFPLLLAFVLGFPSLAEAAPCPPGALGTSRVIELSGVGGLQIGLKTYPQTLQLEDHEVVLTFDDGPNPGTTDRVLDALAKQCVKATFFVIGREALAHPDLLRREYEAGETIGHHSYSHPAKTLRFLPDQTAKADIDRGFAADDSTVYGASVPEPRVPFFRFPGFADTPSLVTWLSARNIVVFGADFWAFDWLDLSPEEELGIVLRKLEQEKHGILLLHDSRLSTALMLPALLDELKARGFKIVHLMPGQTPPVLQPSPPGWSSETEAIIARLFPQPAPAAIPKNPMEHNHR